MIDAELNYFIHQVDGARYGAWYRVISAGHIEVIAVGMLETAEFAGFSPESSARSILENFVREQRALGMPLRSVDSDLHDDSSDQTIDPVAAPSPDQPSAAFP